MNKEEFLNELESRLQGLPRSEIRERINFYDELIQDMVEEGKTEKEAIESFGGIDEVVRTIAGNTKMTSLVKERIRPKRHISALEVVLLIIGFPLWFPLLITFFVLMIVGYFLLWIFALVTYVVEFALIAGGVGGLISVFTSSSSVYMNYGYLGLSLLVLGFGFLFIGVCVFATKVNCKIAKNILVGIKNKLIGGK